MVVNVFILLYYYIIMFNHIPVTIPELKTAHSDGKHFYVLNGRIYPSITTILHSFPNPGIEYWKANTPNWETIQNESLSVGTELHRIIESYLSNKITESDNGLFQSLQSELDKIDNIQALEKRLYEPDLFIAGTVDCIAQYNGKPYIIDFKNSRKPKKPYMIKKSGYYEQVTAYSKMWEYCTGQRIDNGMILIANWDETISKYEIHIPDYEENLMAILENYN